MAISTVVAGASGVGTTSCTPTYPTVAAGDLLLAIVSNKYPTNAPSITGSWTQLAQVSGGSGSNGIDTGSVYTTIFYKTATGSESGTETVSVTSGNSVGCRIFRYRDSSAGGKWVIATPTAVTGSDNSAGTSWSIATGANLELHRGDVVQAANAINADTYTYSAQAFSATGVTFGTVTADATHQISTNQGQDHALQTSWAPITAGPETGNITHTMTASGSATNAPAGSGILVRVRPQWSNTQFDGTSSFNATITVVSPPVVNLAASFAGVGTLTGALTKTTNHLLAAVMSGTSTFTAQRSWLCSFGGTSTFIGFLSLAGILPASSFNGVGVLTVQRSSYASFGGTSSFVSGSLIATHARQATFSGEGTFTANMTLNDTSLEVFLPGSYVYVRNDRNRWR